MSWNPLRRKGSGASGEQPPPADVQQTGVGGAADRTDPLAPAGGVQERVDVLRAGDGVELAHVEVWGERGLSDTFLRLVVADDKARADVLRDLVLGLPEEVSGFRDLLAREGAALAASFEMPQLSLDEALTGAEGGIRPLDALEALAGTAGLLGAIHERSSWVWAKPDLADIGLHVVKQPREPDGYARHRMTFTAWDALAPGDEAEAARALGEAGVEALDRLGAIAVSAGFRYAAEALAARRKELADGLAQAPLTYTALAALLDPGVVRLDAHGATDVGQRREHNEDGFLTWRLRQESLSGAELTLAAVADGMGGHASGEVASTLALDLLRNHLIFGLLPPRTQPLDLSQVETQLEQVIPLINRALVERAALEPSLAGMGTTLCGLASLRTLSTVREGGESAAAVFNVGDSRAYLLGTWGMRRLSRDHSFVQELLDSGGATEEEAFSHPMKSVITRCLGGAGDAGYPDVFRFAPGPGEIVLLCSDGLSDALRDRDIWKAVAECQSAKLDDLAAALIAAANRAGGPDNITVVLIGCS